MQTNYGVSNAQNLKALTLLFIVLLVLLWCFIGSCKDLVVIYTGIRTEGVVIEKFSSGARWYAMKSRISFQDKQNINHTLTAAGIFPNYIIGDKVNVYYAANDPSISAAYSAFSFVYPVYFVLILILVMIAIKKMSRYSKLPTKQ